MDVRNPHPNDVLQALLDAHGLGSRVAENRVWIEKQSATMSAEVFPRASAVQLDVRVHLADGRTLVESFAGLETKSRSALADAFDGFARSSLHVLMRAFLDADSDVEKEEWMISQAPFIALVGDLIFKGQWPTPGEETSWFEPFVSKIENAQLSRETHWIRCYYAQHRGEQLACEVLLDNADWAPVREAMTQFAWPRSEAFYSVRLFLVLQPN